MFKKYAKKLTFCNYVPDLVPYMTVAGHRIQHTWCLDQETVKRSGIPVSQDWAGRPWIAKTCMFHVGAVNVADPLFPLSSAETTWVEFLATESDLESEEVGGSF